MAPAFHGGLQWVSDRLLALPGIPNHHEEYHFVSRVKSGSHALSGLLNSCAYFDSPAKGTFAGTIVSEEGAIESDDNLGWGYRQVQILVALPLSDHFPSVK